MDLSAPHSESEDQPLAFRVETSSHEHSETQPPLDGRRTFLAWVTGILGGIFGLALTGISAAFFVSPLRKKKEENAFQEVTEFDKLPLNEPRQFVLRETTCDCATMYPNAVVGRVYLVRKDEEPVDGSVYALSTTCPHKGCSVNYTGESEVPFLCPCHAGKFDIEGNRLAGNPSTREMYRAQVKVDKVQGKDVVLVKYQLDDNKDKKTAEA